MVTIYTIGFTKKTLEGFIKILKDNNTILLTHILIYLHN